MAKLTMCAILTLLIVYHYLILIEMQNWLS